jgi:hypothetical protein
MSDTQPENPNTRRQVARTFATALYAKRLIAPTYDIIANLNIIDKAYDFKTGQIKTESGELSPEQKEARKLVRNAADTLIEQGYQKLTDIIDHPPTNMPKASLDAFKKIKEIMPRERVDTYAPQTRDEVIGIFNDFRLANPVFRLPDVTKTIVKELSDAEFIGKALKNKQLEKAYVETLAKIDLLVPHILENNKDLAQFEQHLREELKKQPKETANKIRELLRENRVATDLIFKEALRIANQNPKQLTDHENIRDIPNYLKVASGLPPEDVAKYMNIIIHPKLREETIKYAVELHTSGNGAEADKAQDISVAELLANVVGSGEKPVIDNNQVIPGINIEGLPHPTAVKHKAPLIDEEISKIIPDNVAKQVALQELLIERTDQAKRAAVAEYRSDYEGGKSNKGAWLVGTALTVGAIGGSGVTRTVDNVRLDKTVAKHTQAWESKIDDVTHEKLKVTGEINKQIEYNNDLTRLHNADLKAITLTARELNNPDLIKIFKKHQFAEQQKLFDEAKKLKRENRTQAQPMDMRQPIELDPKSSNVEMLPMENTANISMPHNITPPMNGTPMQKSNNEPYGRNLPLPNAETPSQRAARFEMDNRTLQEKLKNLKNEMQATPDEPAKSSRPRVAPKSREDLKNKKPPRAANASLDRDEKRLANFSVGKAGNSRG